LTTMGKLWSLPNK